MEESVSVIKHLNYSKGNYALISEDIREGYCERDANGSVEESWNSLVEVLKDSIEKNIPVNRASERKIQTTSRPKSHRSDPQ